MEPTRLLIVSHDLSENAAGRAHVIWTLARHLGIRASVIGTSSRGGVWLPLRQEHEFLEDCRLCPDGSAVAVALKTEVKADVLILPVKTWPASLGTACDVAEQTGVPLLVDIDDPDHMALVGPWAKPLYRHAFRVRMRLRGQSPRAFDQSDALASILPRVVSNPELWRLYGEAPLVPHARAVPEICPPLPNSSTIDIAFVGTPRSHKGLTNLREAVSLLAADGFTLTVTADPPGDARPWERWVGITTLEQGRTILRSAQAVVLATSIQGYGRGQLPAKLVDAMAAGIPVVASRTAPVAWALGDAGRLVEGDAVDALTSAMRDLMDPALREKLGVRAHARARAMFDVPVVAGSFAKAIGSIGAN